MKEELKNLLQIFVGMLGSNFSSTEIVEIHVHIKQLLENRIKATDVEGDITALMLYASFDITDDRLENLLQNQDYVTKSVKLGSTSLAADALSFAAVNGSLNTLKKLFETNYFDQESFKSAIYYAAMFGQAEIINFFHEKKINLFQYCGTQTALMVACENNQVDSVKAILATKPTDKEISMARLELSMMNKSLYYLISYKTFTTTAYKIAKDKGNNECIDLLKDYPSSQFYNLIMTIFRNDVYSLEALVRKYGSFMGDDNRKNHTLLSIAAERKYSLNLSN